MELREAEFLAQAAQDEGLEARLYENYTGRGMYGETTAAVVGNLGEIMGAALRAMWEYDSCSADVPGFENFNPRTDFMGLQQIIY